MPIKIKPPALPWMSRSDRRAWRTATTLTDLGQLMARYLQGDLASRPGYQPNCRPDPETSPEILHTLAALNRAGFLTTDSQPGTMGTGFDGAWWSQRAAVTGFVDNRTLLAELLVTAADHALQTVVTGGTEKHRPDGITITTRNNQPMTAFGRHTGRRDLHAMWPGTSRPAFAALALAWQVTILAPEYGASGQRMWTTLNDLTNEQQTAAQPGN